MTLEDVFDGELLPSGVNITGMTSDSRAVEPGFLFAALKGVAADGHDYIPQALANGAVAVLASRDVDVGSALLIKADEPRLAFAKAAAKPWRV